MHPELKAFFDFLAANPAVWKAIKAFPGKTLLYTGDLPNEFATKLHAVLPPSLRPSVKLSGDVVMDGVWTKLGQPVEREEQLRDKEILPQVLGRVALPPQAPYRTLGEWVRHLSDRLPAPAQDALWRGLSRIFASNAEGAVSFLMGFDVGKTKVFVDTELPALLANPSVDITTRNMLLYYQECVRKGATTLDSLIRA
jgi:hypothetical protein